MRPNRLFALFRANAARGEFRAEGNVLWLYDFIVSSKSDAEWLGGVDAETFVKTLAGMTGDVQVRINSPGGDVFAGIAMANAIRGYSGGTVHVFVDGYAASAASVVATAADRVTMAAGAFQMIHRAWTIEMGNTADFLATAELLGKIDDTLAAGYADTATRRGVDADAAAFLAAMDRETWMTAEEAMFLGLADDVAEDAPKARAAWNLSAYSNAPAAASAAAAPSTSELTLDTSKIEAAIAEAVRAITPESADPPAASADEIEHRLRLHDLRLLATPA
jgi:ATP-dependent Clp protease, protease subunit